MSFHYTLSNKFEKKNHIKHGVSNVIVVTTSTKTVTLEGCLIKLHTGIYLAENKLVGGSKISLWAIVEIVKSW